MPCETPPLHVTKREAAKRFKRSERSISRDLVEALKTKDMDTLVHCQLGIENGTLFPGTEISVDRITELRDEGANPLWFLHTHWLEKRYGLRIPPPVDSSTQAPDVKPAVTAPDPKTTAGFQHASHFAPAYRPAENDDDPYTIIAILERQIGDLKEDKQELRDQLKRSDELRAQDNELREQNNILMKEIYKILPSLTAPVASKGLVHPDNPDATEVTVSPESARSSVTEATPEVPVGSAKSKSPKRKSKPKSKGTANQAKSKKAAKRTGVKKSVAKNKASKTVAKKSPKPKASEKVTESKRVGLFGFFRRQK